MRRSGVQEKSERPMANPAIALVLRLCLVVRILPQNDNSLQDATCGNVLFGGQLGPFATADQYRCRVGLEAGDLLGLPGLSCSINCLADTNIYRKRLEVLVQCDQHSWIHRAHHVKQEVMRISQESALQVETGVGQDHQSGQGCRGHQEPIRMQRVQGHQAFPHVQQSLRNSHHEQSIRVLGIKSGKLPQHASETAVVGSSPHQPHGEDSS
mmetsp:Transcript_41710/g.100030  ORF Transcript_41710/g.100030 Transcript_41710/m.100030 type:complete len:211 (-) Transcript_41710:1989-2621(-)